MAYLNGLITILDWYAVGQFLLSFILGSITVGLFLSFFFKKEKRLFKNRRRPIMVIATSQNDLDIEVKLLKDSGLFKLETPTNSYQETDRIKDHSLLILGYSVGMEGFDSILSAVRNAKIPLIVYTKERLDPADEEKLRAYSWYSVCNFPLKLINDVFTILSTFPEKE